MTESVLSPFLDSPATLFDVAQVASIMNCSPRHVYRLADSGAMPRPRRLGALVRWSRLEIEAWVAGGCRPCRPATKAKGQ